jgi:hypothetical protein
MLWSKLFSKMIRTGLNGALFWRKPRPARAPLLLAVCFMLEEKQIELPMP